MRIGVDFDNTIVCYDNLFAQAARERGLIEASASLSKQHVRDELRRTQREHLWTELQGYVYGDLIRHAAPFPGVGEFFQAAASRGAEVYIISHKTRRPYLGADSDLRQAAHDWLRSQALSDAAEQRAAGLPPDRVFFEDTKEAKLRRIASVGCTHFIDDLPEFLREPEFPAETQRILFDPWRRQSCEAPLAFAGDWREITAYLFPGGAA